MPAARPTGAGGIRPHVVVTHRRRDRYALHENYVNHVSCAVSCVTTEVGIPGRSAAAHD